MAVYGPSYAEELYHWKYKYKKRINGKWRYYYDETNLSKNNYKTIADAKELHKEQKSYEFKSIAEKLNANETAVRPKYTEEELARILSGKLTNEEFAAIRQTALTRAYDELETSKTMSEYYAQKAKYYDSVYQEVLDQLGEETMMNADAYMVNTWHGHDEFKKKYFNKLAAEAAAEEEAARKASEYATQEEADDAAERARMAEEARAAVQEYAKKYGKYRSETRGSFNDENLDKIVDKAKKAGGRLAMVGPDEKELKKEVENAKRLAEQLRKKRR